jgi:hypothetical protein
LVSDRKEKKFSGEGNACPRALSPFDEQRRDVAEGGGVGQKSWRSAVTGLFVLRAMADLSEGHSLLQMVFWRVTQDAAPEVEWSRVHGKASQEVKLVLLSDDGEVSVRPMLGPSHQKLLSVFNTCSFSHTTWIFPP